MVDPLSHRYEDGPTTCRPSTAVLRSIQQSIKKSRAMSAADVRLAAFMGLVTADVQRPTGFNDGVFYPPSDVPSALITLAEAYARVLAVSETAAQKESG